MSDILLKHIAPDGVEVTSCLVFDLPNRIKGIEICAQRVDVPTGIGTARTINVKASEEMFADDLRTIFVGMLRSKVKEAFEA